MSVADRPRPGARPERAKGGEDGVLPLPADFRRPRYGDNTLADVLPGAVAALGAPVQRDGLPPDPLDLTGTLAGARRVAVLLVDGLGADLVRRYAHLAPTLAGLASPAGSLSAPCPSTTAVSLATLGTGLPPGAHGILGYVTSVPGRAGTLNHTRWADDPDPRAWQAQRTVFEQATAAGVATTVVGPYAYARSGLTEAVYRGAHYAANFGPGDMVAGVLAALHAGPRALAYGYHLELDLIGHVRGVDSPAWRAQLALVDRMVEQLVDGLPDDAALLVTADHGMLDVPDATRLDVEDEAELMAGVRLLAGEPRARYVHAEDGAAEDLLHRWREVLGSRAWVLGRNEAVATGIFGPVSDAVVDRIGDVVALARGSWALTAPLREPGPSSLAAYHGSLTDTELAIPLLLARGRGLR